MVSSEPLEYAVAGESSSPCGGSETGTPPKSKEEARAQFMRLTRKVTRLPAMPQILNKIWDLAARSDSSARELSDLISKDEALTSKILSLANSAYFGFSREISSVNQATVILGFNTVKSLSISASVFSIFGKQAQQLKLMDREQVWKHSFSTALAAKMLAARCHMEKEDSLFTAAILHDVGKLVLMEFYAEEFCQAIKMARKEGVHLSVAEATMMELDHCCAGSWLAERWQFPPEIKESIAFHHHPRRAPSRHKPIVSLIHNADMIARQSGCGTSDEDALPEHDSGSLEILKLGKGDLEECQQQLTAKVGDGENLLMLEV